jgi:hypothetical protein
MLLMTVSMAVKTILHYAEVAQLYPQIDDFITSYMTKSLHSAYRRRRGTPKGELQDKFSN